MNRIPFQLRREALLAVALIALPAMAAAQQAQPASAATPAAQTAPAPRPPVLNRVNEALPSWLRVRGEFRERMEGFDGSGFVEDRRDLYYLSRLRLNATVTPSRLLSFQVQAQDARVAKKTVGAVGTPFKAPFDVRMAFADVGAATSKVAVRVGRQ